MACHVCGRTDVKKMPRRGKRHFPHKCPHGVWCVTGHRLLGLHANNVPIAGSNRCEQCIVASKADAADLVIPAVDGSRVGAVILYHDTGEEEKEAGVFKLKLVDASRAIQRRITAHKHGGDDAASWAVFVDGRAFVNGLTRREVPYYKEQAYQYLLKN